MVTVWERDCLCRLGSLDSGNDDCQAGNETDRIKALDHVETNGHWHCQIMESSFSVLEHVMANTQNYYKVW